MERKDTFNAYIQQAIRDNWNRMALSDFDGMALQYRDVARKIAKLHLGFENAGIKQSDKIAIIGKNSTHWSVAFLAVVTYGAVAVPILHDFHPDSIHHLINHSDARIVFCDENIWKSLDPKELPNVEAALDIFDYSLLLSRSKGMTKARESLNLLFGEKYPDRFLPENVVYPDPDPDQLAVINYTSGSTGFSKGVMLSYRALWSNLQYCIDGLTFLKPGDGVVCMLPLAHMFGLMVDLLHCFTKGCHIHFLTRLPTPKVLLGAFAVVQPKLIVSVPLVIEKIIKSKVMPELHKLPVRLALLVPGVRGAILKKVRKSIIEAFGGQMKQIIIGGASLSSEVESLLREMKFPFTVGYGMTECAPLIAYAPWEVQRPQSCGRLVDRMECRVDSADPANVPGVLWVKGDNVMSGYYKNDKATAEVMDGDWMSTGDICTIDKDGFIYIRGRAKTMILGPSGQNIYPEEIEQVLNNLPYVAESLIIPTENKLIALIYPDSDNAEVKKMTEEELDKAMDANIAELNKRIPSYSKVGGKRIMKEEFQKTPKRSIKRYLYNK